MKKIGGWLDVPIFLPIIRRFLSRFGFEGRRKSKEAKILLQTGKKRVIITLFLFFGQKEVNNEFIDKEAGC